MNICQNIDNNNCEPNYLFNIYSDCFFLPLLIVFNILDKIYFNKFLTSKLYSKYVDELLATANSVCNNENAIINRKTMKLNEKSTKEPLLEKNMKKNYNIEYHTRTQIVSDSVKANTNLLVQNENYAENVVSQSNGNSLANNYNSNNTSKIQIGHVDSFGRYYRQIDDEPVVITDKKKPFNKFMNFLNKNNSSQQKNIKFKFSSTDLNEDEEETMALKAAEMLINDVVGCNRINN